MQKVFKRVAIALLALAATICTVVLAACQPDDNKTNNSSTTDGKTITFTVKDENGSPIDGTTFGEDPYDPESHQVFLQFCISGNEGQCCIVTPNVGKDGKATMERADLKTFLESLEIADINLAKLDLHVIRVEKKGYSEDYNTYTFGEMPNNIEITLKKA